MNNQSMFSVPTPCSSQRCGRWTQALGAIALSVALGACTSLTQTPAATTSEMSDPAVEQSTLLLVSLEDGSLIRQEVAVDADICMKSISAPTTVCLKQGEPIMAGNAIIAYEMLRTEIELYGE